MVYFGGVIGMRGNDKGEIIRKGREAVQRC